MSALYLVNQVPSSIADDAEFRVFAGEGQLARLHVSSGGTASVETVVDENHGNETSTV